MTEIIRCKLCNRLFIHAENSKWTYPQWQDQIIDHVLKCADRVNKITFVEIQRWLYAKP